MSTAVLDAAPLLGAADLELLQWAADYYHHPVGEVFATALPRLLREGRGPWRPQPRWRITDCRPQPRWQTGAAARAASSSSCSNTGRGSGQRDEDALDAALPGLARAGARAGATRAGCEMRAAVRCVDCRTPPVARR